MLRVFVSLPSGNRAHILCGFLERVKETYNWPWAKQWCRRSIPTLLRVCPSALLIVKAYATFTGNCFLLKTNSLLLSDGIRVTRGMNTAELSSTLIASMILGNIVFTMHRVPLTISGCLMFRNVLRVSTVINEKYIYVNGIIIVV